MTKSITNMFGLVLFTAFIVALFAVISFLPTPAAAKEKGDTDREGNERSGQVMQRIQKSIDRHTSRRGHAFAWGHYKGDKNDDRDDDRDDVRERNGRGHATTTPPVIPPTPPVATTTPPVNNQITLTASVVATHNTQSSCWMTIGNNVYNVTPYIPFHPGGVQEIVSLCGANATTAFGGVGHSSGASALLANYLLGALGQTITI